MPSPEPMQALLDEAAALHRRGALGEAADCYTHALGRDPANATALYHLAQICCQQARFAEGVDLLRRALAVAPSARAHVLLGRALAELGNAQEALASFDRAIVLDGAHAGAHGNRGDALAGLGRLKEATESYRRAIAIEPAALENWCNLGAAQAELGLHDEALASYERVIALEPSFLQAHLIRGKLLTVLGRHAEALASYDRALAVAPRDVAALTGRADALAALKRPADALAALDAALAVVVPDADMLSNRAFLLHALNRHDEALANVEQALEIDANHAEAWVNHGVLLSDLARHAEAIASYDRALAASPGHVRAFCNRSKAQFALGRHSEALASADQALAIEPAHVESLYARGHALDRLRRYAEAIAAFEGVLELAPSHPHALAYLAASHAAICAWEQSAAVGGKLFDAITAGTVIAPAHSLIQLSAPSDVMLINARRCVASEIHPSSPLDLTPGRNDSDKIRVAYLSGDFRAHATAYLMSGLFECHDRNRFEIIGLSCGPDDRSDVRARIVNAFDHFHDLQNVSDRDAAALIRRLGIDIVVDLAGHTEHARLGILQYRPAPVQASYLVYPGTVGADFLDYIIADRIVLPLDQQQFYAEKIVHLPDCYQVNDRKRVIAAQPASRADVGLPPEGFVFCCFNNNYKIGQPVFEVWMRLLDRVPVSVLWLLRDNIGARDNLCREAAARGINPARLIFAERASQSAHLARHRLADLFLDTPGCNAHTTASDALWAGLPILTCIGSTFAGRVAASLLHAIGLPDMVTDTLEAYDALALRLAREPKALAEIRQRLEQNRLTYPLFDTERFARHIERAYETMREYQRQGRGPQSFSVAPLAP